MEDKPWRTEELRSLEEALSQLLEWKRGESSEGATRSTAGVGCDGGFHSKVPLDLSMEKEEGRRRK